MASLDLSLLEGELVVARLEAGTAPPDWVIRALGATQDTDGIVSVTATANEISVVCAPAVVPEGAKVSPGWIALAVAGPLDHGLTGVLASIAGPLAEARVPIFAVSTFDTDYVLVPGDRAEGAVEALRSAGHRVEVA